MSSEYLVVLKKLYFCSGEMAEWSNAAVLKTVEGHTSGGSNPSFSAKMKDIQNGCPFSLRFCRLHFFVLKNKMLHRETGAAPPWTLFLRLMQMYAFFKAETQGGGVMHPTNPVSSSGFLLRISVQLHWVKHQYILRKWA